MSRFLQFSILVTVLLLMIACIFTNPSSSGNNTFASETVGVTLVVQPQATTFNSVGQQIPYTFTVSNTTTSAMPGPVTVTDDKMPNVTCPPLNTIGDKDESLDPSPSESIICTATYTITTNDVAATSVTNVARAKVGTFESGAVSTVIKLVENKVLTIAVTATPNTYNAAGQQIRYQYTIRNTGTTPLGPTQFIVRDDHIPDAINCGTNSVTLLPNEVVSCEAIYTTKDTDVSAAQIVNSATASGAGAGTIAPGSATVTNTRGGANSGNYTKGTNVQHNVTDGEWMIQIARCYGANIDATLSANPQVLDPDVIFPTNRVTVPNIGSVGTIYGPPCVKFYTVKSGDSWETIASDPNHDASVAVLMEANKGGALSAGRELKIPVHSRSYGSSSPTTPTTPTTPNQPIPLNFPAGTTKVTPTGNINTPQTIRYSLAGATGQILTVKLTTPSNDVNLAIYAPNGSTLKNLDPVNSWTGTLAANGQYIIELNSSVGAATKQYSLEVTLANPSAPAAFERVVDINPTGDSNVSHLRSFLGELYFQANKGDNTGNELWRYNTGLSALNLVRDINNGPGSSDPAFLTQFGNFLYFRANGNDNGGAELWRFNGTDTGRVTDINNGIGDSNPMYLTVFKEQLYFRATGSDGKGAELWKYDGLNPSRVSDINPDAGDANPAYLTVFKDVLYFSATSNDSTGTELWKYDGTNAPSRVADIYSGINGSNPQFLAVLGNFLYFSANGNDGYGIELWKYDGTNPPIRAADINAGPGDSIPTYITVFKDALYFAANGDASGIELWTFNGTAATRVADINPSGNSNPAFLAVHNNELYFQANAGDGTGAELWKYRGP